MAAGLGATCIGPRGWRSWRAGRLVLLDCAHNVASAKALVRGAGDLVSAAGGGSAHLIFAGNQDKDLAGMLGVLAPRFDRILLTSFAPASAALRREQLAALLPPHQRGEILRELGTGLALGVRGSEARRT